MSNLVTFEQGMQLKRLGFRERVRAYYIDGSLDFNNPINWNTNEGLDEDGEYQEEDECCSAPPVSDALDWVREEKGIECGVYPIMIPIMDGLKRMAYAHSAFDLNKNCKRLRLNISLVKIDTHHLASSALLDAVLTYLEQKEQK